MSLRVASLHVYPIKSLGGFAVDRASTTDRGFEHDRRWMLVDEHGSFITQREERVLACLHVTPNAQGFRVTDLRDGDTIDLPWTLNEGASSTARVFSDMVDVLHAPMTFSAWFADKLQRSCSLTYMPDAMQRHVDAKYAQGITSLSDGFPYLILSQASLDGLNARLEQPLPMDRFRPNIVLSGGEAHQEDRWREVHIGDVSFNVVKPCGRCVITTADQRTGERGVEPLRTLATYRRRAGAHHVVDFGMNAMAPAGGVVRVGDGVWI